jgi:hypothetical protein
MDATLANKQELFDMAIGCGALSSVGSYEERKIKNILNESYANCYMSKGFSISGEGVYFSLNYGYDYSSNYKGKSVTLSKSRISTLSLINPYLRDKRKKNSVRNIICIKK